MTCLHTASCKADCTIEFTEDSGRFLLGVRVHCQDCGKPFVFLGLPAGVNLEGAAVSVDGTEARLAIAPEGTVPTALDLIGVAVRGGQLQ